MASRNDLGSFCPTDTGCVIKAINDKKDLLTSGAGTDRERVEALMFLIDFVGDLHQPLHASDNSDRGGNCVPITFFGTKPKLQGTTPVEQAKENFRPNLHGVWDNDLVKKVAGNQTASTFADKLSQDFASQISAWKLQPVSIDDWAWERHEQAVETVYGKLSKPVPQETPQDVGHCSDNNHVSMRMKTLNEKVGPQYRNAVRPVIEEQFAKAGTRLAMLLNQIWPQQEQIRWKGVNQ